MESHQCLLFLSFTLVTVAVLTNPLSTIYVRNSGCDVGVCSAFGTDYSTECLLGSDYLGSLFDICCHRRRQLIETEKRRSLFATPAPTCLTIDYAYSYVLNEYYNGSGQIDLDYEHLIYYIRYD